MVVIYMHNSVKVCGPTTMKPIFYKPVLVFFWGVSKRNLFLQNKFLVRKQNRARLQSCFVTNTAHITSTQAECKKAWLLTFYSGI